MALNQTVRDIGKLFIREDVQKLLKNLTGFDMSRIYKTGFNIKAEFSKMELLNDEQLKFVNEKAIEQAKQILQIPPVLKAREPCEKILSEDKRLNPLNLKKINYIFTDISLNVPHKSRIVLVRESDGKLRTGTHDERERMIQTYFPREGATFTKPAMFEPKYLEECLKLKNYLVVLKKACIKLEPDDPEFIRITNRVYDYVNEIKDHDRLYSTRFFGSLTFYLAWNRKSDNLIEWYLNTNRLSESIDFIRLYNILNESKMDLKSNLTDKPTFETMLADIENFIKQNMPMNLDVKKALEIFKSKK